ncbi:MAG: heavy-metal-associated domain-containing protein [Oscillospiraceae bacterium]|jgi:copper chaperone CopZ|nr:heavy-metal-associated domain-containing protein [Oscillospiraceae bacterium]
MKKTYRLKNLDCANCAAKMEASIGKLAQVESVSVSFMTQRMSVTFADDVDADSLLKEMKKRIKKVEPDCEVAEQ